MRNIFSILTLFVILSMGVGVCADTFSIVKEENPVSIPYSQDREFQLSMLPQANTTVLLKIKSRMDFKSLGGSMHFMKLILNGREIFPTKGRIANRLINKPLESPVEPKLSYSWYDNTNGWNVLYAPDFQGALAQKHYVDNPYVYVFDVTDLINPVAESRLKIMNTATRAFLDIHKDSFFSGDSSKLDLVIGSLEIETKPVPSPMMAFQEPSSVKIINRGEPAAGPARYRGELMPGGGIALHIGKSTYRFNSSFSYPDAGFNHLSAGAVTSDNQKGWKVSTKGNRSIAQGPDYAIIRKVNFHTDRVQILDSIKNLNKKAPLGLCVRNELDLKTLAGAPTRLAGNPDPAYSEYHSDGNPSVHIVIPEGGLGIITDDDVYRHQSKLYVSSDEKENSPVAGIKTEMFRLAPGETYTLEWSIYPVAGPDYFDFVNIVRKNWDANYTAFGPWRWGFQNVKDLTVDQCRDIINDQDLKYFIDAGWTLWKPNTRIGYGTDVFSDYWAPYRESLIETITKFRQASKDIKIFWYYNHRRESADDTLKRFSDSLLTDEHGDYSISYWKETGSTNPCYTTVPTLKNSFGKAMLEAARRYLDEFKLDGIYRDEGEGLMYNHIFITYNDFDGHSCILDPKTWRIKREVGIVPLLEQGFSEELTRIIHERGKIFLTNGPTGFKKTLKNRMQVMCEIQHNDIYPYEGNLQTPLGYMSWTNNWDHFLRAFRLAMLPAVCLTTVLPHDISQHMFPFTTIELHSGYLLGQERIIATHSGNYGWPAQHSLVRVRHFNNTGKLTTTDFTTTFGIEARTDVTLQEKEAIVLERLPISFKPANKNAVWSAKVSKVNYDSNIISLDLIASHGGVLSVDDGAFKLKNGATVAVRLGSESRLIKVMNNALKITVPVGFSDTISIAQK